MCSETLLLYLNISSHLLLFRLHTAFTLSRPEVSTAAAFFRANLPGSLHCLSPLSTALLQVKSPRVLFSSVLPRIMKRKLLTDPTLFQSCIGHSQALALVISLVSLSPSRPSPPSSLTSPFLLLQELGVLLVQVGLLLELFSVITAFSSSSLLLKVSMCIRTPRSAQFGKPTFMSLSKLKAALSSRYLSLFKLYQLLLCTCHQDVILSLIVKLLSQNLGMQV